VTKSADVDSDDGHLHLADIYSVVDFLGVNSAPIFRVHDGGSKYLQNLGNTDNFHKVKITISKEHFLNERP
jgi:hypothetical protein